MQKLDTIAGIEGRKFIHSIFRDFKFKRQLGAFQIITILWKICCFELDLKKYTGVDVVIRHRLGMIKGTSLWLEEILNRFYFSSALSFVYFGASILIIVVGVSRFTEIIPVEIVISSVVLESLMLVMIFVLMLFSPKDDSYFSESGDSDEGTELLMEIGEIGRDLAAVVVQLEKLGENMVGISRQQQRMIDEFSGIGHSLRDTVSPNPEMLKQMKETNKELGEFTTNLSSLNLSLNDLKKENVESAVKIEISKIINKNLGGE